MKRLALIALLLLTACGDGGGGGSKPTSLTVWAPPGVWQLAYGTKGIPVTQEPVSFRFPDPSQGSANYLIYGATQPLQAGLTMKAYVHIEASSVLKPVSDEPPATMRLFFERKGDDLTGNGDMQSYRWWSASSIDISNTGDYILTETLTPDRWTDVYGRNGSAVPELFQAALNEVGNVGMTFGGKSFAGHGDAAEGGAVVFTLTYYSQGTQP